MMEKENIIAHRGIWTDASERNSVTALKKAIQNGIGIETDLRDYQGEVVICHDSQVGNVFLTIHELFEVISKCSISARIALNIKSDPWQNLPPYEKLVDNLSCYYSIN